MLCSALCLLGLPDMLELLFVLDITLDFVALPSF